MMKRARSGRGFVLNPSGHGIMGGHEPTPRWALVLCAVWLLSFTTPCLAAFWGMNIRHPSLVVLLPLALYQPLFFSLSLSACAGYFQGLVVQAPLGCFACAYVIATMAVYRSSKQLNHAFVSHNIILGSLWIGVAQMTLLLLMSYRGWVGGELNILSYVAEPYPWLLELCLGIAGVSMYTTWYSRHTDRRA